MNKKLLSILLVCTILLTGCGQSSSQQNGGNPPDSDHLSKLKSGQELIIAVSPLEGTFDPCAGWGQNFNPLIQSKLFQRGADNQLIPDIAKEYSISEDGLIWTITLRDDVKFSDNTPLTAMDVAFTYNQAKQTPSEIDLTSLQSAIATGDYTLNFVMNQPFSPFLYTMTQLAIVPQESYTDSNTYSQNPMGSGPYQFVSYTPGEQLILEQNPNYYGTAPNFQRLVFLMMDADAAFSAVKAGAVDVAHSNEALTTRNVDGYYYGYFEQTFDYRMISLPVIQEGTIDTTGDPMGNPVTSDPAIREALFVGINRDQIFHNALYSHGKSSLNIFEAFPWGKAPSITTDSEALQKEAAQILKDGGWQEVDGVLQKEGIPAEFTLMYSMGDYTRSAIAQAFAAEAKLLGIQVNVEGLDWSEIEPRAKKDALVLGGGVFNPMDIANQYYSNYATQPGYNNVAGYQYSLTDDEIQRAISSLTEDQANTHWQNALSSVNNADNSHRFAYIPIGFVDHLYVVRNNLSLGEPLSQGHDHGLQITDNVGEWEYKG